jgi:hypothetical protein
MDASGRWGFIDHMGHFSIPAKYDTCEPFTNGLARIEIGTRFGWIDQQAARHPPAELPRVD